MSVDVLSGEEALALSNATDFTIDLQLTDVVMKDMNSRQLAEIVSAKRPGMKFVSMSGYTENTIARGGVLGKDTIFIQKPVRPGMFSRKFKEVFDFGSGQENMTHWLAAPVSGEFEPAPHAAG